MSRIFKIIITTLMLIEISIANDEATFFFEPSFLLKNSDCFQVSYSDYNLTPLGRQISLPSKTYFVELSDTNSSIELNWTVIKKDLLYKFEVEDIYGDIPTTDIFNRYSNVTPSARKVELGSAPILSEDIVYVGDKRWVKFLVFPVTIDNSGQLYFNQTITLTIGSQIIKPEQLVTIDKVYKKPAKISYSSHIEIFGGNIEYLIITSALLQEPFERLALYKSSVGIKTKVELIEEILPLYSGRDDAEKLREYLKQFYAEGGRYVLLGGDETQLPLRYAYPNSTDEPPPLDQQQICDLYFADLTGEWDVDNDNIWGEKNVDQADLNPELKVGRVPFSTVQEADNFVDKIIQYETNPGGGDPSYLEKVFFFTSDQMRDYSNGGQHGRIAAVFPEQFYIDTVNGIEIASGNDLNPTNLSSSQLVPILSDGYGIVNIINHGSYSSFSLRTSGYNQWPKSYFTSDTTITSHGNVSDLYPNNRISFYYSVACDNGAFDLGQPPFNLTSPSIVESLLGLKDAGAVSFVANSRWGWVGSSHYVKKTFYDSLFAHPDRIAIDALYDAKAVYYYYLDQVYGLNFYGDPTLKVYMAVPDFLSISTSYDSGNLVVTVLSDSSPIENCNVILSKSGNIISQSLTNDDGEISLEYNFDLGEKYTISAVMTGYCTNLIEYTPSIVTDIDEVDNSLPESFTLGQNYPNPFNPSTTISFNLPEKTSVNLSIYNILGQAVAILKNETLPSGQHKVEWNSNNMNGQPVTSGVYFYRLETDSFSDVKKMLLLR